MPAALRCASLCTFTELDRRVVLVANLCTFTEHAEEPCGPAWPTDVDASTGGIASRLRLQPRAVGAARSGARTSRLMREAGVDLVAHQHLRLVAASSRATGEYDFARPRRDHRAAARRRHPRQPRHRHRVAAAVADHRRTPRSCPMAETAPPGTPAVARPGARARRSSASYALAPRRAGRPSLRRAPGRRALARLERARLPQRALLLRRRAPRRSAAGCARRYGDDRRAQRGVGHRVLEPDATATGTRSSRRGRRSRRATPAQMLDFHRFSSDELLDYYRAEAEVIRAHSDRAHHHELHGHRAHPRTSTTGPGRPRWTSSPTTTTSTTASPTPTAELVLRRRPHPRPRRGRPVDAHGAVDRRRQLAAAQPRQGARRDASATRSRTSPAAPTASASSSGGPRVQGAEKFHSALLPHAGTDTDALARGR